MENLSKVELITSFFLDRLFSRFISLSEYKTLSEIKPVETRGTGKNAKTVIDTVLFNKIQKQKNKIIKLITGLKEKRKRTKPAGEGVVFHIPKHLQLKNQNSQDTK